MGILIRDTAHHLLLECWAEHHYISNGYKPKVFEHPIPVNFFKNGGKTFKDVKPFAFYAVDSLVEKWIKCPGRSFLQAQIASEIIPLADNRMIMGDFRYGVITRQDLDNYDAKKEYGKRLYLSYDNRSLEYLIDAYNMCRIQYLKDNNDQDAYLRVRQVIQLYTVHKIRDKCTLNSVDDGHHAKPIN